MVTENHAFGFPGHFYHPAVFLGQVSRMKGRAIWRMARLMGIFIAS